jgi:hypothetical protein
MLSSIRGHVRKQPQFVLGLHGLFDSVPESGRETTISEIWEAFQLQLTRSVEQEWQIIPTRFDATKIVSETPKHSRNNRYDQMRMVGHWKQNRLSLVDLGFHGLDVVSQFGRHCDGVILVLAASRSVGIKWLDQLRIHNIPWLGYWDMEVQSLPQLQKVG